MQDVQVGLFPTHFSPRKPANIEIGFAASNATKPNRHVKSAPPRGVHVTGLLQVHRLNTREPAISYNPKPARRLHRLSAYLLAPTPYNHPKSAAASPSSASTPSPSSPALSTSALSGPITCCKQPTTSPRSFMQPQLSALCTSDSLLPQTRPRTQPSS